MKNTEIICKKELKAHFPSENFHSSNLTLFFFIWGYWLFSPFFESDSKLNCNGFFVFFSCFVLLHTYIYILLTIYIDILKFIQIIDKCDIRGGPLHRVSFLIKCTASDYII